MSDQQRIVPDATELVEIHAREEYKIVRGSTAHDSIVFEQEINALTAEGWSIKELRVTPPIKFGDPNIFCIMYRWLETQEMT
jgi:hypothetical protein